jgi:hypothetical protein
LALFGSCNTIPLNLAIPWRWRSRIVWRNRWLCIAPCIVNRLTAALWLTWRAAEFVITGWWCLIVIKIGHRPAL